MSQGAAGPLADVVSSSLLLSLLFLWVLVRLFFGERASSGQILFLFCLCFMCVCLSVVVRIVVSHFLTLVLFFHNFRSVIL